MKDENNGEEAEWKLNYALPMVYTEKEKAELNHAFCIVLHAMTDLQISTAAVQREAWNLNIFPSMRLYYLYDFVM